MNETAKTTTALNAILQVLMIPSLIFTASYNSDDYCIEI